MTESSDRPVVACYCATFLKPEMRHIYRQITSLRRVRPIVIAQKREQAERYPFDDVRIVPKPRLAHLWRRLWYRQLRDAPWQISRGELHSLRAVLNDADARLLHIYFGHIAVHLLPLMRTWNRPTLVSFHGADVGVDLERRAYAAATLEVLSRATLVLVRSESLAHALRRLGGPPEKLRVQRTGIPLGDFALRKRLWPATGEWRLLQAGRLIEKKGIDTTLRAFAEFQRQFPPAELIVAGEGPLLPQLEELSRELGIEKRVAFTGFLSDEQLRVAYQRAHLFVHPSQVGNDGNQEGVPNSILEAMATGLPVFATRHGGIPEAIENNISGVLVPERDHVQLARALISAARTPELLERLSLGARRAVTEKFDQKERTSELERYYFEALAG